MNATSRLRIGIAQHRFAQYQRILHTKAAKQSLAQDVHPAPISALASEALSNVARPKTSSSTSHLAFPALLKTYIFTAATSSPFIIAPSIRILSAIAYSKSAFLSPDKNPILHWLLKMTVYRHFCAGENASEVHRTVTKLRSTGIKGIILCYAREVELRGDDANSKAVNDSAADAEIEAWAEGLRRTINLVPEGNFVSIKFSGAGALTLHHLQHNLPPPEMLANHLETLCSKAYKRKIRLCIDAEQSTFQAGIDTWTINLMRRFNTSSWPCIYNTYQTYLLSSPKILATHLSLAAKENFILGAKLVRGAYLASEPRSLFWPSKEATDTNFDILARGLIKKDWSSILEAQAKSVLSHPARDSTTFPQLGLVLATHNLESCRTASALRQEQALRNEERIDMVYAQLQGMADHVTGELVGAAKTAESQLAASGVKAGIEVPRVCKYLTWGTVGECSKYLVRRAEENRDAVARTIEARRALGAEIWKRLRGAVGLL